MIGTSSECNCLIITFSEYIVEIFLFVATLLDCPCFREENGDLITILFDCRNAGLKNMDMEFIQFIIG